MSISEIPSVNIGGNIVSPTPDGKVKVQTAKGKTRVLTQDQFEKSIIKNADNIKAGKDFEIKKSNTTAKILGLVATAGAITAGIIFRKDLGKFIKNAGAKISQVLGKKPKMKTVFDSTPHYMPETKAIKEQTIAKMHSSEAIKAAETARATELKEMQKTAKSAFKNYDGDAVIAGLKEGKNLNELGLTARHPQTNA